MADKSQDIGLFNNDLFIEDGDLSIMESDVQHVSDTIAAFPGWWKENAPDGVGILQYSNGAGIEQELNRSMKIQLSGDGYRMTEAGIFSTDGRLILNPNAEKL